MILNFSVDELSAFRVPQAHVKDPVVDPVVDPELSRRGRIGEGGSSQSEGGCRAEVVMKGKASRKTEDSAVPVGKGGYSIISSFSDQTPGSLS